MLKTELILNTVYPNAALIAKKVRIDVLIYFHLQRFKGGTV